MRMMIKMKIWVSLICLGYDGYRAAMMCFLLKHVAVGAKCDRTIAHKFSPNKKGTTKIDLSIFFCLVHIFVQLWRCIS